MYTETKNNKKLKSLYNKALQIKSAIPHPKIMGVIRECGGKMHMGERESRSMLNAPLTLGGATACCPGRLGRRPGVWLAAPPDSGRAMPPSPHSAQHMHMHMLMLRAPVTRCRRQLSP